MIPTPRTEKQLADEQRVRPFAATFRNILWVVALIFVFSVVRTIILAQVTDTGMHTATSLQQQGLPALKELAALQENLALYRLDSYEYLFAQDAEKAGDAKAADDLAVQMHAELKNLKALFPEGEGRKLAFTLEKAVDDLDAQFQKVRGLVDTNFPAAMKSMDQDIPPMTARVEAAATALKLFGYQFSGAQASATFDSFGWIKSTAVAFGIANSVVSFLVFVFVLLAARRARAQLSETLARLDARTQELQQTNGALETEVVKYQRSEKMLRESEERFASAFEFAPIGMALVALDGRWVKVNRAICAIVGYTEAELLARTFQEITHPDDLAADLENLRRLLAGEIQFYEMEKRYIHARGNFVPILLDVSLVRDAQHQPLYFIAQIQDITERKRAEAALLESKRFLRSTLDALTSHIAILDEHGTIIEVNAQWNLFARENNFMASHGVGENYLKVCDSAAGNFSTEAPLVAEGIRAVIAGKREEFHLEYPCHGPREKRWFLVRVTRFGGDGPVRVVVAHENITERKRAQESLVLFRTLIDQSNDAIVVVDAETRRYLDVNEAACASLGYSRKELLSMTVFDIDMNLDPLMAEKIEKELKTLGFITFESGHRRKDGTIFPAEVALKRVQLDKAYVISIVRDITDRKKLEGQLMQSQKMETVGKLAGGIAHEFNSILTAIIGQSELLLEDLPAGSPLTKNATEIIKASNRAATLTRQLLAYGRRQFLQPEILDLNRLISDMGGMLHNLLGGGVDAQIVPAFDLHAVKADAGQIEQVIVNLVMNARDAMPNGGKLTLETANVTFDAESVGRYPELKPGGYAMLAISDTGTGMSDAVKARLFEPFFTTKDVGQGTGLGLSTCYGIVKQSGGHISVYSELGRGTTFKIYLPQVEPPPKIPVQRLDSPDLPRGTETILLVEDDPALRDMAAGLLRRLGYTVLTAANGVEALTLKQQRDTGHVDLLLTDVVMPHMSGKELADRVRVLYPLTKILFTSAYTEHAIIQQGVLDKGVALLQKPFTPSALANKLREMLDGKNV
jgi:two-component system, cell cycle sensor histidine kinase and response regulator CckA